MVDYRGEPLDQAVRLAALDLLIKGTDRSGSFPNTGHWLLFGNSHQNVQDPNALNSRRTSIHVLLELVNDGVPRFKERKARDSRQMQVPPLYIIAPVLAERCYRVIYQLCTHPRTSEFVTRYLRTREDFFARQISSIPAQAPECRQTPPIQVAYGDGLGVITTVEALRAFLRLRSYIFDLVAFELRILTGKGHHKGVTELLEILFRTDVDYKEEHDFPAFRKSLVFEWADSLQVEPMNIQYLDRINLQASVKKDTNGYEVVDRPTLLGMLASAKQQLLAQGVVAPSTLSTSFSSRRIWHLDLKNPPTFRLSNFHRRIVNRQSVLKPDPDDLNPLYVYEAKLSLFIRIAQTWLGAERLLEAQLIPTLARCAYLDTMPEADQAFMATPLDNDSFLPSAIQRYHQLFTPAVQVVNGIVAILGNKHATASSQALEFLSNHSSTISILLKTEPGYVTLAILEETYLVVTLSSIVLPAVPRTELLSTNSGFGVIHSAILSLSTRCLGLGKAFDRVIPQSDAEVQASNIYAFEPAINLVLSPITITPKREENGTSHFSATVPTVGDALAALDDLTSDLGEVLKQISNLGAELANKHQIGTNDMQEILRDYDRSLLQELEIEQTRSLVYREVVGIRAKVQSEAKVVLTSPGALRRATQYEYATDQGLRRKRDATLTDWDPSAFRNEAAAKLAPVLNKLNSVELASGKEWQDTKGYIEIMCRRLKDSDGLLTEDDMAGSSP
ncbi:hypothetical protein FA15DRAFT_711024 [Coprinopsis marcescibilis]|uniref:Uncharacterized protein n=1 Tax=Coprinopsis marcescibilis TaxID=230819 RepID=A0A5C3KBD9_COPMA|nr:hypothetical protein FA15DRAFT_711024 [Coprinopsis marcescibilis]